MHRWIDSLAVAGCAVLVALTAGTDAQAQSGSLVLYNANYRINDALVPAFKKRYPDIDVQVVSGSTGPIAERVIAEAGNPQTDVVYLINDIALDQMAAAGALEPYEPKDSAIDARFMNPDNFFTKYFFTTMVMVVNTERLKEKDLPMPTSWESLLNPAYHDEITIASPALSGTGMAIYSTLLDAFGWHYIENLDGNILQYNDGGGAAGEQAGRGETTIGLTYDTVGLEQQAAGHPVEIVFGGFTPNVAEGGALIAGARNPDNAKLFLDWMASEEAAAVYDPFVGAATIPGYGSVDISDLYLWERRRPLDTDAFVKEWSERTGT
jgi:iron(III) transport system substrate-binding protein